MLEKNSQATQITIKNANTGSAQDMISVCLFQTNRVMRSESY